MREQYFSLVLDPEGALAAIPKMLPADAAKRKRILEAIRRTADAAGTAAGEGAARLAKLEKLFAAGARAAHGQEGSPQGGSPRHVLKRRGSRAQRTCQRVEERDHARLVPHPALKGAKALVVGVANDSSIAYGCAKAFRELGADLALTYLSEKARPHVEPLARELDAPLFLPLNVAVEGELEAVFDAIGKQWGELDILVHSIAFAPKEDLQGGLLDCSASGFATAMDVSCHSFVRMAKLAAPLMKNGGTMMAMSYHGASKVVPTYSVMGPVKAALESCCRYLAYELGGKGIRVHAISPGPLKTRAASGLKDFDLLLTEAAQRAPIGELVDIMDVGFTCAYLATPYARRLSGETLYVDGGVNIMA